MTMTRNHPSHTRQPKRVTPQPKWRMIGVEDLPTVTKAEFIMLVGERGVQLRPSDVKYVRFIDKSFWFIHLGQDNYSDSGCASSWKAVTDDGKMNRCFEIDEEKPIYRSPLKSVVPARSKLRVTRGTSEGKLYYI